ncbi:MAG TPA: 4Fe-4S binding protein [Erysipelothrix sp.]|nr:4Fe-4S binding protein [Erysipelothrix sp.]
MPVRVDQDTCIGCEACISVCPTGALSMNADGKAECEVDMCIDCEACIPTCPTQAIEQI